jgi:hypothetical protein
VRLAVDPGADRVYVVVGSLFDPGSQAVTVIHGAGSATETVPTPILPGAIAVDPVAQRASVLVQSGFALPEDDGSGLRQIGGDPAAVIDGIVLQSASASTIRRAAVDPRTGASYASYSLYGQVYRADWATHTKIGILPFTTTNLDVVEPTANRIWISGGDPPLSGYFQARDATTLALVPGTQSPSETLLPDGDWAANPATGASTRTHGTRASMLACSGHSILRRRRRRRSSSWISWTGSPSTWPPTRSTRGTRSSV